jgi:hypothetical protein
MVFLNFADWKARGEPECEEGSLYADWIAREKPNDVFMGRFMTPGEEEIKWMWYPKTRLVCFQRSRFVDKVCVGRSWVGVTCTYRPWYNKVVFKDSSEDTRGDDESEFDTLGWFEVATSYFIKKVFGDDITLGEWLDQFSQPTVTWKNNWKEYKEMYDKMDKVKWRDGVVSVMKDEKAATLIQAAFRGWKTRRQYRLDPYNRFGKWLVMRKFYSDE